MLFTREFDYAVRIVRFLSSGEQKTVSEINADEHVPLAYAYKVLKKMREASLLTSTRGVYGGYRLAISAHEISLYDVYMALEDRFLISECLTEGYTCSNDEGCRKCAVRQAFYGLQDGLIQQLKDAYIGDILDAYK